MSYLVTPQEHADRLLLMLEQTRKLATQHPVHFVDFVMLEETTRRPIYAAPHQRVLLKFAYDHPRCVIMLPVGHTKTFSMGALALFELGNCPTSRGAIVSATQGQAAKVLAMVRDYVDNSKELHMVFPGLVPSPRRADPWTTTAITVDRPPGIRDASLVAVGVEGALPGSRLKHIVVDDILTHENTATKEARDKVYSWFDSTVLSRIDTGAGARVVVTNTAWHPEDLLHRLTKQGWPTLRMEITGRIEILNDDDWDCVELKPESADSAYCRLAALPDTTSLWPDKYPMFEVERLRAEHLPSRFNQLYRNICRDDATSRCKIEWIEACKKKAAARGIHGYVSEYRGANLTFTGVDLAVQPGEEHDDCAFFTIEVLPDGHRRILDIDVGQFDGPTIIEKLFDKHRRYNSVIRVESNAAQDFIRQFALDRDVSLPIKAHVTGRAKAHPEHGVEGFFVELSNGAWLIPSTNYGEVHPNTQRLIDACLFYSPTKHTDDILMSAYFAREQAKAYGAPGASGQQSKAQNQVAGTLRNIMMR